MIREEPMGQLKRTATAPSSKWYVTTSTPWD